MMSQTMILMKTPKRGKGDGGRSVALGSSFFRKPGKLRGNEASGPKARLDEEDAQAAASGSLSGNNGPAKEEKT